MPEGEVLVSLRQMSTSPRVQLKQTASGELYINHEGGDDDSWWAFAPAGSGPDDALVFSRRARPPPASDVLRTLFADALYGAFRLLSGDYVAVVVKSRRIARGPHGAAIHQIEEMRWLPVRRRGVPPLTAEEREEEEGYLKLLREIADTNSFFYSSYGYELTSSLQRFDAAACAPAESAGSTGGGAGGAATAPIADTSGTTASSSAAAAAAAASAAAAVPPPLPAPAIGSAVAPAAAVAVDPDACDERFFWNKRALGAVLSAGPAARAFVTPVINGLVLSTPCSLAGTEVELVLISRRACTRQGTRFNMRGADETGAVANYAETEQIVLLPDGAVSSFVQVRGSVPLLWEQPASLKYAPRAVLRGAEPAQRVAFGRHMRAQLARYGAVTAVNLIDKSKDQKMLGDAYAAAVAAFGSPSLRFVWFDFHDECKKMRWGNLRKLVDMISDDFSAYGVYAKDMRGVVTSVQRGVLRTNCMDNLDRTNVVQSLFARRAALHAVPGAWGPACEASVLTSPHEDFEAAFNNAWGDNADALSMLYAGTGALKTDFTRTGKRTIAGALADGVNSVKRYVLNNLADGHTQDAWDLFLGRYTPVRRGGSGSGSVAGAAGGSAGVSPLRTRRITPAAFLVGSLALFLGLAAAATLVTYALPLRGHSLAQRASFGAGAAALTLGGFAYIIVAKGAALGRLLVSRPLFVPAAHRDGGADASSPGVELATSRRSKTA